MIRHWIASDIITNVGYDKDKLILEVELKNKEVHGYFNLSNEIYREFMDSDKRDEYFKTKIDGKFTSIRSK
ncbi:MAG TPA: KTSC domain-containing protein [Bacteroidia bacterium]|jgi:hypothetical protein|nr:KTSC domain-containing protein [Bacteroidia bacterium]